MFEYIVSQSKFIFIIKHQWDAVEIGILISNKIYLFFNVNNVHILTNDSYNSTDILNLFKHKFVQINSDINFDNIDASLSNRLVILIKSALIFLSSLSTRRELLPNDIQWRSCLSNREKALVLINMFYYWKSVFQIAIVIPIAILKEDFLQ